MGTTAKQLLERVASWPDEDIVRLEEAAREIEAMRRGEYRATEDELRAIDEAIAELDRGDVATEAQVRAIYAKFTISIRHPEAAVRSAALEGRRPRCGSNLGRTSFEARFRSHLRMTGQG
jgi:hypothetical protein